jgi:hypothetical protein
VVPVGEVVYVSVFGITWVGVSALGSSWRWSA